MSIHTFHHNINQRVIYNCVDSVDIFKVVLYTSLFRKYDYIKKP